MHNSPSQSRNQKQIHVRIPAARGRMRGASKGGGNRRGEVSPRTSRIPTRLLMLHTLRQQLRQLHQRLTKRHGRIPILTRDPIPIPIPSHRVPIRIRIILKLILVARLLLNPQQIIYALPLPFASCVQRG